MASKKTYFFEDKYGSYTYRLISKDDNLYIFGFYTYYAEIIDFTPKGPEMVFPSMVDEYDVNKIILPNKIWDKVTSLTFPTLKTLGVFNYSFPSLKKVQFTGRSFYTDGRMIYSSDKTKLYFSLAGREDEVIHVPDYVKEVTDTAFSYSKCKEIVFDNPKVKINYSTFQGSTYIKLHPAITQGDKLVYLGADIPLLDLPDEVTKMDKDIFAKHCPHTLRASFLPDLSALNGNKQIKGFELKSKEAPLSVMVLKRDYPFLVSIKVPEDHIRYEVKEGALYDKLQKKLLYYPSYREGTSYEIAEGTLAIGPSAFYNSQYLEEIKIPDSVKDIASYAFSSCPKLRKINLPAGIDGLSRSPSYVELYGAINTCSALQVLTIPQGVKYFGYNTIYSTRTKLKDVMLPDTMEYLGPFCFPNIENSEVHLPASLLIADKGSLKGCTKVRAYEGTAKGLVLAINPYTADDKSKDKWNHAQVIVLDQTGEEKAFFLIPALSTQESQEALAMAWDSEEIDYDAYDIAFRHLGQKQETDKLLMALLLVIDGGRRGAAWEYLHDGTNLLKCGSLLIEQGWKLYFDSYLALEGLTSANINSLLEKSNTVKLTYYRKKLTEKKKAMGRRK